MPAPDSLRSVIGRLGRTDGAACAMAHWEVSLCNVATFGSSSQTPSRTEPRMKVVCGCWRSTRQGPAQDMCAGQGPDRRAPPAGLEPAHTAPEADALSAELRGRGLENTRQKTSDPGRGRESNRRLAAVLRCPCPGMNVSREISGAPSSTPDGFRCCGLERGQAASRVRRRWWRWSASPLTMRA
jgi:hypothetical protein